ncbi:ABC transporter substrate-binding protein [Micromonospora sp. NPDC000207]|uniref:ABC transporter substrate-binding protein n=1 Tax=Micromonospora sp. NPDC000207 TaxID=3154246 RepID=UPI0033194995
MVFIVDSEAHTASGDRAAEGTDRRRDRAPYRRRRGGGLIRRGRLAVALATASVLVLSGCFSDGGSAGATDDSLGPPLKVTQIGFPNEIALVWALNKGIFAKHGIAVEPVTLASAASAVAAADSGQVDLAFSGGWGAIVAASQGVKVKIVMGAYFNPTPPDPERSRGVFASTKSGAKAYCDLVGKTVGVTELNGPGQVYTSAAVRKAGCDDTKIKYVNIPSAQMATSLEGGAVDAINASGAIGQTLVRNGGAVWLGEPYADVQGRINYANYVASEKFVAENGDRIEKFRAAMDESISQIKDPANEAEWQAMAAEFGKTTVEAIRASQFEELSSEVDASALQTMADIAYEFGAISQKVDTSGLIYERA